MEGDMLSPESGSQVRWLAQQANVETELVKDSLSLNAMADTPELAGS